MLRKHDFKKNVKSGLQNTISHKIVLHKHDFKEILTVIPQSSLHSVSNHQRVSNQFHVSLLDKYPQPANSFKGTITPPSLCHSYEEKQTSLDFRSSDSLQQIYLIWRKKGTPEAVQMKVETCIENRMWATRTTKGNRGMACTANCQWRGQR